MCGSGHFPSHLLNQIIVSCNLILVVVNPPEYLLRSFGYLLHGGRRCHIEIGYGWHILDEEIIKLRCSLDVIATGADTTHLQRHLGCWDDTLHINLSFWKHGSADLEKERDDQSLSVGHQSLQQVLHLHGMAG